MPPKSKNNAFITNFFKPATSAPNTRVTRQSTSGPKAESRASSRPASPESQPPQTPSRPAGRSRDAVIAASDEDDGLGSSSDDGLEDLMAKFDPRKNPLPARSSLLETPRARRTRPSSVLSSPLTINTRSPNNSASLMALAADDLEDEVTHASSLLAQKAKRDAEEEAEAAAAAAASNTPQQQQQMSGAAFMEVVQDQNAHEAQKVLRAVQRADPGQSQLRYCFFGDQPTLPASSPAPSSATTGPWRLLFQGTLRSREQFVQSGIPQTLAMKKPGLPDELFLWVLDDICVQESRLMQLEYIKLVQVCPEKVKRLVTPELLGRLFLRLGAREQQSNGPGAQLIASQMGHNPYQNRSWAHLQTFLKLLEQISDHVPADAAAYALQVLLRMALDKFLVCTTDVLADYEAAFKRLVDMIPASNWDEFCLEASHSLYKSVPAQCIRINALLCLPISSRNAHNLRRRLAVVFLYDNPSLGGRHPDEVVTISGINDCLDRDSFTVTQKTDFAELKANVLLLNIAIDDGSFVATNNLDHEKDFNEEVDELAARLRDIWRRINDSGMKLARTEAKSVIEWVQKRVAHSVRTKKKVNPGVFGSYLKAEDKNIPKQQDFMKQFIQRQKKSDG